MPKRFVELKYGAAIGIGTSLWVLLEYLLGFHGSQMEVGRYTGYFAIVIPLVLLWFAIKEKKNQVYGGTIRLSQGMKTSLLLSMVAGVILGAFMYAYFRWINPEFVELAIQTQVDRLRMQGLSEEELIATATGMLALFSPIIQAGSAFLGAIVQGTIIGSIYTIIQKRKNATPVPLPGPATNMGASDPVQDIVTDLDLPSETDEPEGEEPDVYEAPLPDRPNT